MIYTSKSGDFAELGNLTRFFRTVVIDRNDIYLKVRRLCGAGQFAPKLGGQFELESGGQFRLESGGQFDRFFQERYRVNNFS